MVYLHLLLNHVVDATAPPLCSRGQTRQCRDAVATTIIVSISQSVTVSSRYADCFPLSFALASLSSSRGRIFPIPSFNFLHVPLCIVGVELVRFEIWINVL